QGRDAVAPALHDPLGEDLVQGEGAGRAVQDVLRQGGLLGGQLLAQVVGGDLLVHRVSLDVLVVEAAGRRVTAQPPQARRAAGGGQRGGRRQRGRGPGERPPGAAVQADQRHDVGDRERDRRYPVEVGPVGGVQ